MQNVMRKRKLAVAVAAVVTLGLVGLGGFWAQQTPADAASARIEIWHGLEQRVGHLGDAQADFNLLGRVAEPGGLVSLEYTLNDAIPVELNFRRYRRLAAEGHFNADIPLAALRPGLNTIELKGRFVDGAFGRRVVTVTRSSGASPLPFAIDWAAVTDPQDVGQYVDGQWQLGEHGLRTAQMGYDRLFLIGDQSWQDYEVTAEVMVHEVAAETGPVSGGNGVGLILRFAGHVVGGPGRFPVAQPKWGYQPLGAIVWLRWRPGRADGPGVKQFVRGDSNDKTDHGKITLRAGEAYVMKALCQTLPDDPEGRGVSRYAFKLWPAATEEPPYWDWQELQVSRDALRRGGVGLVAHHVDASFGNIRVVPLEAGAPPS